MSLLADALQPFIVGELISLRGRTEFMALPDVIVSPTVGYDLTFDENEQSILIEFREPNLITTALAADSCRFSSASFQTISLVTAEMLEHDSVAWSLVKLYYSAFYAGHALIRLLGEGCSFFNPQHTRRLVTLGAAYGRLPVFNIDSGLYRCILTQNATALKCTKARAGAGGAHESFWYIFGDRMQLIAEDVLKGGLIRSDAQAVFSQLERFRELIHRRSGYSWLSSIRNDVQYRHQYGVWYPKRLRQRERGVLSGLVAEWIRDPMQIDLHNRRGGVLGEFATCCIFVVALCRTVLARIADRSTVGSQSFARLGPMTFLNHRRMQPVP